jgi:hypothetical protein
MTYWTDLIWVGNTLLPRWFAFAISALAFLALIVGFTWLFTWLKS